MTTENLASFKLRLLATLNDLFICLMILGVLVFYVAGSQTVVQLVSNILVVLIILILPWIGFLYPAVFTYYLGGTVGKLLTGLKVTDEQGKRLSFRRSLFRYTIGYSFSSLLFGLGFWAIIKNPQKQGWHDQAVGSKVFKTSNLWPLAIVTLLIFGFISFYLFQSSYNKVVSGPLTSEVTNLIKSIQQEFNSKPPAAPSKSLPNLPVT